MSTGSMGVSIDPAKYSHDTGAMRIAIESVEELHEIFIESFYNVEQAELAAATEGVELVGSDYEIVAEASMKETFTKVKEFIKKLWDKVNAWLHNVKRFILSLFMNTKKFIKKYEKDIREAKLKDFKYTMYTYTNIDNASKELETFDVTSKFNDIYDKVWYYHKGSTPSDTQFKTRDEIKAYIEPEEVFKRNSENKATTSEEYAAYVFGKFRNGAKDENDKTEVSVTSLSYYVDTVLDDSVMSDLDTLVKKTDEAYKMAIDTSNNIEKRNRDKVNTAKAANDDIGVDVYSYGVERARLAAQGISQEQSATNTMMTAWKTAITERTNVYQQLIMAGLANSRKSAKSDKES